ESRRRWVPIKRKFDLAQLALLDLRPIYPRLSSTRRVSGESDFVVPGRERNEPTSLHHDHECTATKRRRAGIVLLRLPAVLLAGLDLCRTGDPGLDAGILRRDHAEFGLCA